MIKRSDESDFMQLPWRFKEFSKTGRFKYFFYDAFRGPKFRKYMSYEGYLFFKMFKN